MSDVYGEDGDMNDKREKRDKLIRLIITYIILARRNFSAEEVKAIFAEAVAEWEEVKAHYFPG